jgi:hypothetical protein
VVSTTPRPLYPLERTGTHCTEGGVGRRAGLDVCEKSRPHRDSIPGPSSPLSVSVPSELHGPHSWRGNGQIYSSLTSVYVLGHWQVVGTTVRTRRFVVLMTTCTFCCCYIVRVEGHTLVVQDKQVTFLVELRKESAGSFCIQFNRTTPSPPTLRIEWMHFPTDNRVHADRRTASSRHLTWQGQCSLCIKSHVLIWLSANGSTSADVGMCCDLRWKLGLCSPCIFFVVLLQLAYSESVCWSDSWEYLRSTGW